MSQVDLEQLKKENEEMTKRLRDKPVDEGQKALELLKGIMTPKDLKINFPDLMKVMGEVSILNKIEASIMNFPTLQKITGEVKAVVDFPETQRVIGQVDAKVRFPDIQKIQGHVDVTFPEMQKIFGEVVAKVQFPEVQKVSGKVQTDVPIGRGVQVDSERANPSVYVPVRLTNGQQFYDAISTFANTANNLRFPFANSVTGADQKAIVGNNGRLQVDVITQPAGGAAGTQYADGDTAATPTGNQIMGKDGSTIRAIAADSSSSLKVHITANDVSASGGTSAADGATYTAGTTAGTPAMGAFDDASISAVAEDKLGIIRMSSRREAYYQIRDAQGNERGAYVNSDNALRVGVYGPVGVAGNVTISGSISGLALESGGNLATAVASLSVLDDWDESDRAKVNMIVGQAGITAAAGSVAANTPRFTLASDDPAVAALQIIDNFISGSRGLVTEDNSAAIAASLSVLDDWDETNRAAVNIIPSQVGVAAGSGAQGANTQRVILATDDPAVSQLNKLGFQGDRLKVYMPDSIGSVTMSGLVSASGNFNLTALKGNAVDTNTGNMGIGTLRVVIATDQTQLTNALKVDGSAVTQPVSAASLPLPLGAATSAKQDTQITAEQAIQTAVEIMDDWDETNRAAVNTIAGQVGVQGASGTVSANTQRVVLATDVALPAGTNAIGKLAANSGVDIGDVDVTSIAAGDNNIGNVDLASAIPAGTNNIGDVDVLTVPADPFGANADAAVSAGATGSISAKLRSISRDLVANIVLAAGTNAIGKLAANNGVDIGDVDVASIAAGDNNIGNVDLASSIPAGTNNIGDVDVLTAPYRARTTDAINATVSSDAVTGSGNVPLAVLKQPINVSSNGQVLISGMANRTVRVLGGFLISSAALTFQVKSNNNSDATGPLPLIANEGFIIPYSQTGNFESLSGQNLTAIVSAAGTIGGWLTFVYV